MILYLIRGLPGSGKSTLAEDLHFAFHKMGLTVAMLEADQYFVDHKGVYKWRQQGVKEAHLHCQQSTETAMMNHTDVIIVANTFTQRWELESYYTMAENFDYVVQEIICRGEWQNVHNVPQSTIERMRDRFEL